ncbi:MAG: hypothetical protein H0V38_08675 [Sporichthyaceae bacterium]|nr:hypothetical protein [Sporichthyaceae bacterium]
MLGGLVTVRATPRSARRAHPEPGEPDARRTTRLARTVTYGLCGGLLLLGIAQVEVWPLSAFRLFSGVRGPEATSWQVVVVDSDGSERLLDLAGMPDRVGLPHHLLPRLVDASPAVREDVLETYVEAAGAGTSAVRVRVYRVVSRTSTEPDVANIQLSRHVAYEVGLP